MSGVKRRSGYRKNVLSEMEDFHEPKENEYLGRVITCRGGNTFEVSKYIRDVGEESVLALLPTRFRKLIWLKRGDYVIISTETSSTGAWGYVFIYSL
jgi:probable RNA-binding protein EIF1AD